MALDKVRVRVSCYASVNLDKAGVRGRGRGDYFLQLHTPFSIVLIGPITTYSVTIYRPNRSSGCYTTLYMKMSGPDDIRVVRLAGIIIRPGSR